MKFFHDFDSVVLGHSIVGAPTLGFVMHLRVEYFRDNILVKACHCRLALEDAIQTAEQGLVLYKAQVVVVHDVEANDAEVARIKRLMA